MKKEREAAIEQVMKDCEEAIEQTKNVHEDTVAKMQTSHDDLRQRCEVLIQYVDRLTKGLELERHSLVGAQADIGRLEAELREAEKSNCTHVESQQRDENGDSYLNAAMIRLEGKDTQQSAAQAGPFTTDDDGLDIKDWIIDEFDVPPESASGSAFPKLLLRGIFERALEARVLQLRSQVAGHAANIFGAQSRRLAARIQAGMAGRSTEEAVSTTPRLLRLSSAIEQRELLPDAASALSITMQENCSIPLVESAARDLRTDSSRRDIIAFSTSLRSRRASI